MQDNQKEDLNYLPLIQKAEKLADKRTVILDRRKELLKRVRRVEELCLKLYNDYKYLIDTLYIKLPKSNSGHIYWIGFSCSSNQLIYNEGDMSEPYETEWSLVEDADILVLMHIVKHLPHFLDDIDKKFDRDLVHVDAAISEYDKLFEQEKFFVKPNKDEETVW